MFHSVGRIMGWAKNYRKRMILGFVCSFFATWCTAGPVMLAAWALGRMIGNAWGENELSGSLPWLCLSGIVVLILLRFFFTYWKNRLQESIGTERAAEQRMELGDVLKRVSLGYFAKNNLGDILAALTTELSTLELQSMKMVDAVVNGYMRHRYCLVIIDPALEDMDGRELLRTMRQAKVVPILVLTGILSLEDEIELLSLGATVCNSKPIDLRRCTAQAHALIRLYMESEHTEKQYYTLTFGTELVINPLHRQVHLKERAIQLTRREFDLLYLLASRPGQVFSREQLYSHIWNADTEFGVDEAVRFQIKSLRKKLTRTRGSYIQTVRGIGYRFDSEKE